MDDEIAPVLLVLAAPDQLRIEIAIAALVGDPNGRLLLFLLDGLELRGGNVLPLVGVVRERGAERRKAYGGCLGVTSR